MLSIYKRLVDRSKPDGEYEIKLWFEYGASDYIKIETGDDKDHKLEVVHTQSEKRFSFILDGICVYSYTRDGGFNYRPGAIMHYNVFEDQEMEMYLGKSWPKGALRV